MTEHEKRIREALELPLTGDIWERHNDCDVYADDGVLVTSTIDAEDAQFIAACDPTALRALLADLDAMRGSAKKLVDAVNYKAAAMAGFADPEKIDFANECVWRAVDQATHALKGAEA